MKGHFRATNTKGMLNNCGVKNNDNLKGTFYIVQVILYLLALFGGIFCAVFGGASLFKIFFFFAVNGIGLIVSTESDAFLNTLALSPIISPEMSFVGAVAAAAYCGNVTRDKENLDSTAEIFDGSNILLP